MVYAYISKYLQHTSNDFNIVNSIKCFRFICLFVCFCPLGHWNKRAQNSVQYVFPLYLHHRRHQHLHCEHSHGFPNLHVSTVQAFFHCLCSGPHPTRWYHCLVQNVHCVELTMPCHILTVYTPPGRHPGPRHHHTLSPTVHWSRSPLCRYSCWFHLPVECPPLVL